MTETAKKSAAYPKPRILQLTASKLAHTPAEFERLELQLMERAADLRKRGWAVTVDAAPCDLWDGPNDRLTTSEV